MGRTCSVHGGDETLIQDFSCKALKPRYVQSKKNLVFMNNDYRVLNEFMWLRIGI